MSYRSLTMRPKYLAIAHFAAIFMILLPELLILRIQSQKLILLIFTDNNIDKKHKSPSGIVLTSMLP